MNNAHRLIRSRTLLLAAVGVLLASRALAAGSPSDPATYEAKALAGDYQAQRNIAFTYAHDRGDYANACVWYLLILRSGAKQIHIGDVSNADLYCGRLKSANIESRVEAEHRANALYRKIYIRK